ncbi:MAG: GGDEF domain-containing protein [Janthinobacterium lividum]
MPEAARLIAEDARQTAFASGDLPALAQANEHLAWFCLMQSRLEDGLRYAQTAISLWAGLCNRTHEAICRGHLAWLMCEVGDEEAIAEAQHAVALAEEADDLAARALVQNALCVVLWMLQQHDLSARAGAKAVMLARQTKDPLAVGRWLLNAALPEEGLAELAAASGNPAGERAHRDQSIDMAREAATICTDRGDTWAACIALSNLVESLIRAERLAEAKTTLEEASSLPGEATVSRRLVLLHMKGSLVSAEGRQDEAVLLLQHALDTAIASSDLCVGAQIAKDLSGSLEACGRFQEALKMHQQFFAMHVRRSAEKSQLRARMLAEQENLRELQTRAEKLEELAGKDALTGLANRRQLDRFLKEQHQQQKSYGLAFIDVDHFKAVNDTLTHLVGDKVLQAIGSLLVSLTREGDCIGRFGGEEFLLVAPSASPLDGPTLCERLRATVADANWQHIDSRLQVTISIGYAFCHRDDDLAETMDIADRRLYEAKRLGRNRCVLED